MVNEVEGGEEWFGFQAVRDLPGLPPQILVVPLAGHTRGHAGVAVDTGNGWLLHAGDAFYLGGEIDPGHPHTSMMLRLYELGSIARSAYWDNRRRLTELNREHGRRITIFCSHDRARFTELAAAQVGPVR
jgi:glyoxylase-like metal-dependent hydrolase (beta-lactamase superfamily II)